MLPPSYRLREGKLIQYAKKFGTPYHSRTYTLIIHDRKDNEPSRLAFIVSSNVSKSASIRNKVKRGMRESVRQSLFAVKKGYDCVLIAKPESARQYTSDIMQEIKELIDNSPLIQKKAS